MARPPLRIGTYGRIHDTQDGGRWRAETRFRMADGSIQRVRRWRPTKAKAIDAVKDACVELAAETRGEISGDTRFTHVADLWVAEIEAQADNDELSPNTVRAYKGALRNWVLPSLGGLQMREVSVTACDRLVKRARETASYDTAKTVKAAASGVCGYAVRHGAMQLNPVRSVGRMTRGEQKEVVSLSLERRTDLYAQLIAYAQTRQTDKKGRSIGDRGKVWLDLPDIMHAMLSTGVRLGELLVLTADDVDPANATVNVGHRLIRITGQGLVRRRKRKGGREGLVLKVPAWSVPMWRARKLTSGGGPLFPSFAGEWLDPSNVIHKLREAMTDRGYGWVTSHVFRKTVATVLDEAGLSITAVADQLGNTRAVAEKHYRAKRAANQANADALEVMVEAK